MLIVSKRRAGELALTDCERLTVDELSVLTGVSAVYLGRAVSVGYLKLADASSRWEAVDSHRMRFVSAREAWHRYWNSPKGRKRLLSKLCRAEIEAKSKGRPLGYQSPGQDKAMDKYLANVDALAEKRGGVVRLDQAFINEAEAMP